MELHDSHTLDEPLTPQEQVQLKACYPQKDSAKAALLEQHQSRSLDLAMLQAQLDVALVQCPLWLSKDIIRLPNKEFSICEDFAALKLAPAACNFM